MSVSVVLSVKLSCLFCNHPFANVANHGPQLIPVVILAASKIGLSFSGRVLSCRPVESSEGGKNITHIHFFSVSNKSSKLTCYNQYHATTAVPHVYQYIYVTLYVNLYDFSNIMRPFINPLNLKPFWVMLKNQQR